MTTLQNILLLVHFIGMAAIIGGYLATMKKVQPTASMVWGARIQLISGLAMVGVIESQKWAVNHAWVGVKLVIAFVVAALLEVAAAKWKKGQRAVPLVQAAAALAVLNVAVAVLWH